MRKGRVRKEEEQEERKRKKRERESRRICNEKKTNSKQGEKGKNLKALDGG